MKRNHVSVGLGLVIFFLASTANPQVTVYDAPNEVHFAATVDTLKAELEQVRTLSSSVNGLRNLGAELKVLSVSSVLPQDQMALYKALEVALPPESALPCIARDQASLSLCQLDASKTAAEQQLTAGLYAQVPGRQLELTALNSALQGAADLKTSSDLGARTGITSASIQSQRLQVELFAFQSALEDAAIQKARRADQLSRVLTSARAVDSLAPMEFVGSGL
jgi:hypothetical protein